ncbi:MAG: glycosyltransferase family 2 protein, partial [Candidatus Hydrogenedentes bacterium]|nr:glycosyltransferase family 2 protein [Candidatus Hydrogenedentota bacterium]
MRRPLVYVLVINWNGLEHLEECFETLLGGTYGNARFLLIDNGSSDGSVGFVRDRFGGDDRVEVLECGTNLGWAGGNNAGMRRALEAGADYVFLLNNDTATERDAVEKLVEMAESKPAAGALAPKMLMYGCPDILNSVGLECSIIASSWDLGIGRLDGERWNEPRQVIGVCGGAA